MSIARPASMGKTFNVRGYYLHPTLKFAIVVFVLILAFILSAIFAISVSVNLNVPVQNSNRNLDGWIKRLSGKGYTIHYADFRPARSEIKAETIDEFETMLKEREATEAYWHWSHLTFPVQIVYGKIWFTKGETTYYVEAPW